MIAARFGHVNVIARDWRLLADFYQRVLGCAFVPPERDIRGPVLVAGTGVPEPRCVARTCACPGLVRTARRSRSTSTTRRSTARPAGQPARLGHIAFAVPSVEAAREVILREGGSAVGEVVTTQTTDGRRVTWTYVTDPEGNILELQAWSG